LVSLDRGHLFSTPCLFYSPSRKEEKQYLEQWGTRLEEKAIPGAVGDEVGSACDASNGGEGDNVASVQAEHQAQSDHQYDQENIRDWAYYQGCGSGFNRVSGSGSGFGIRIRIPEGQNDPKSRKNFKSSSFEVLDGLLSELKASSVTWTFFMEA
jgi:hypothetical protein